MSRAERLLQLMQALRSRRHPVQGSVLAQELGISLRTLYRDIAALQAQGACIDGAPGLGYVLRPGFTLPPLMFSPEEIEALVLGSRWVARHADEALAQAARSALDKIAHVVPAPLREALDSSPLLVGPAAAATRRGADPVLAALRAALRAEHKLQLVYRDLREAQTARTVWPCALGFFEQTNVLVAWCELRQQFRHFRTDRIVSAQPLAERYPQRRHALQAQWRAHQAATAAGRAGGIDTAAAADAVGGAAADRN